MSNSAGQILTVAQMQAAEQALIDAGATVESLMDIAGRGVAEWVWRLAGKGRVTVLCGPGNNGGDGYVIAETLRAMGSDVRVFAATEPKTAAAQNARSLYQGEVLDGDADAHGDVFVDCLFGSGLARPLGEELAGLLARLAASHRLSVAVDVPSGIQSDTGMLLDAGLPSYDLTMALGAWKFAHVLMPASATMGAMRLVEIGCAPVEEAAQVVTQPSFAAPQPDAHKYTRGLLAVVGGEMPGASVLAARAAQGAGAGYVRLFARDVVGVPNDIVVDSGHLSEVLTDHRNTAILVGPGLGRSGKARERLATALADPVPAILDADALVLLGARQLSERQAETIATPHEGEMVALERTFGCEGAGSKPERAKALAAASGMVIVAKGPDTVIAAPDGRMACAFRASPWLSTAGTGDVLAGVLASRVASGADGFKAACEAVWLHGEAARTCPVPFTAGQLAEGVPAAFASCLHA